MVREGREIDRGRERVREREKVGGFGKEKRWRWGVKQTSTTNRQTVNIIGLCMSKQAFALKLHRSFCKTALRF